MKAGGLPVLAGILIVGSAVAGMIPQTADGRTYTGEVIECGSAWYPSFEFEAARRLYGDECAEALAGPAWSSLILFGLAVVALIATLVVLQLTPRSGPAEGVERGA